MSATHPVFAIGALAISLLTAWFVAQLSPSAVPKRYGSLDGLRGLLAMLVMIAHASAWRLYAMTGEWTVPPSRLYTHFAKSSSGAVLHDHGASCLARSCSKAASALSTGYACMCRERSAVMPLYFSFVAAMVVVAIVSSGLALRESLPGSASRSPTGFHSRSATCPL